MILRQRSRHTALIVVMSALCLILLGIGAFLVLSPMSWMGEGAGIKSIFQVEGLDPAAQTGTLPGAPKGEKSPGEDLFGYRINPAPVFREDGTGGDINLQNPAFNAYLMVMEIVADGNETVIYRSQYVAPNQYITEINLQKPLDAGEHLGTAYLSAVDPETLEVVDTLECPLDIKIKK